MLEASRVDNRVFVSLGHLFGVSAEELRAWLIARRGAVEQNVTAAPAYLREAVSASVAVPAHQEDDWDELDEIFLGPSEAS